MLAVTNRVLAAYRWLRCCASSIIFGDRSIAVIWPPPSCSQTSETATPCPHPTSRIRSSAATSRISTAQISRSDALRGIDAASRITPRNGIRDGPHSGQDDRDQRPNAGDYLRSEERREGKEART